MTEDTTKRRYAAYIRVSTDKQDVSRQQSDVVDFIKGQDDVDTWEAFIDDAESGADDSREEFKELLEAIRNDEYDAVVMSEVSRLARKSTTAINFINECVDNGVPIYLLDDMVDVIDPDDMMSQMFANLLAYFAQQEREQMVKRIKSGLKEAKSQGKWTKGAPSGFYREDGYLHVDIEEFIGVQQALEDIENGMSYRKAAKDAPVTRPTLMDIHKDEERRRIYLEGDADDPRVEEAIENSSVTA